MMKWNRMRWEQMEMNVYRICMRMRMKTEMCGDEGDGVEIGRKGGWNNEDEGMMNEMGENEF